MFYLGYNPQKGKKIYPAALMYKQLALKRQMEINAYRKYILDNLKVQNENNFNQEMSIYNKSFRKINEENKNSPSDIKILNSNLNSNLNSTKEIKNPVFENSIENQDLNINSTTPFLKDISDFNNDDHSIQSIMEEELDHLVQDEINDEGNNLNEDPIVEFKEIYELREDNEIIF